MHEGEDNMAVKDKKLKPFCEKALPKKFPPRKCPACSAKTFFWEGNLTTFNEPRATRGVYRCKRCGYKAIGDKK